MNKIIGITGYKQSGKDTVCNILMECFSTKVFQNIHRIGIFDAAKQELSIILGTTIERLNKAKIDHPPIRRLLQQWGDYKKESHGQDYFVKQLAKAIDSLSTDTASSLFIVPDVRFGNEESFIRERGGCILRVDRAGLSNTDSHNSETGIDRIRQDYFVRNHGTLGDLRREVIWVAQFIRERWRL